MMHHPQKVEGAFPNVEQIKRFLGRVDRPHVLWAAICQKAARVASPQHCQWLEEMTPQVGARPVAGRDFLGECICYTGATDRKGYGRFDATMTNAAGEKQRIHWAHRLSYLLAHGELPAEHVGHDHERAHSAACINPWHLSEQTLLENVAEENNRRKHAAAAALRPPKGKKRRREHMAPAPSPVGGAVDEVAPF